MKILARTIKNSAILFSAMAIVGCGKMSGNISPASNSPQNSEQYEAPLTVPLHDTGYEYDRPVQEQNAIDSEVVSADQIPGATSASSEGPGQTEVKPDASPVQQNETQPEPVPKSTEPETERKSPPVKVLENGILKPTVYYFPVYNEDKELCDKDDVKTLHGVNGEKIINVCPKTLAACGLQGSCAIIQKGVRRSFNISDRVKGQDRFFEMTNKECPYGYGVRSSCLDPFYTLAADLDIYKPGDVIFVPAVVGMKLPDGSKHDGYFIVRDQGRGINGKGRFDFYSGFLGWNDAKNPFRALGLADVKTNIPYSKVGGDKAQSILKIRGFPGLPPKK